VIGSGLAGRGRVRSRHNPDRGEDAVKAVVAEADFVVGNPHRVHRLSPAVMLVLTAGYAAHSCGAVSVWYLAVYVHLSLKHWPGL